jgi:CheY-like chemotaxis protein
LVISKRLAELMKGEMWAESEPGVGSTFFFTVSLRAVPLLENDGVESRAALLHPCRVLIVDDNATNRKILEIQLKNWGMTSTEVTSGPQALAELAAHSFDIVLVDLQMPDMDGVTLAREIRRQSQVPMVLLSSAGDVQVGEAGSLFQSQIQKPVKQSQLLEALQRITGATEVASKTPGIQFDGSLGISHPLRVLLAEDNKINQKVGLLLLSKLGYQADLATNGAEAVAAASATTYDLILMDVQMPEMDGIEATRRIKEKLGPGCPFIAALTADALEGSRERLLGLGFNDYLSKPLNSDALQRLLRSVRRTVAATANNPGL